jgi:thioredoxin-like negative regulator of GroEL
MRIVRAAFVVLSLLACVWFSIAIRQAHDTARASAIVSDGAPTGARQEREVSSLVDAARLLNPDKEIDVLLGEAEIEHGDYLRARHVLEAVTRSEPENIEAWLWLAHSATNDRSLLFIALLHVRQLDPPISPG